DVQERMKFWNAMRGWFALKGYTLYLHSKTNPWEPNMVYEACAYTYPAAPCTAEPRYPYAYIGSTGEPPDRMYPALASIPNGRAVFAQDKQTRHIAIKLVKGGSEEHKILQIIHDDKRLLEKENFCGVIPVLDMLEFDGHWFAVMPRNANTLVNHVTNRDIALAMLNTLRLDLRSRGDTLYVLFDFNLSIKLSSEKCLPAEFSMYGVLDKPLDTTRGQIDFDPFAYDVACLGIYLCHSFQVGRYVIKRVPNMRLITLFSNVHALSHCWHHSWMEWSHMISSLDSPLKKRFDSLKTCALRWMKNI
ncbi:hypothetical protein BDQ12DRAFT_616268, partial [Crucibulum laeve]